MEEQAEIIAELNQQRQLDQRRMRQLTKEKEDAAAALEALRRDKSDVSEWRARADAAKSELATRVREYDAKLLALDTDSQKAISRVQGFNTDLKSQLAKVRRVCLCLYCSRWQSAV
jgi:hypothetical protein